MPHIFISYRRADSQAATDRIFDYLEPKFPNSVFKDVDFMKPGEDFQERIRNEIERSDVVLIIMGTQWGNIQDKHNKVRLQNTDDAVRFEVETALQQHKLRKLEIIPILVNGATMPEKEQLPESIQQLVDLNAISIRNDPGFKEDILKFIKWLKKYFATLPATKETIKKRNIFRLCIVIGLIFIVFIVALFLKPSPLSLAEIANQRLTQTAAIESEMLNTLIAESTISGIMTQMAYDTTDTAEVYSSATAKSYTATPTSSATPSYTPTNDFTATAFAQFTLNAQMTSLVPTDTPVPTSTPSITPTLTLSPTKTVVPSATLTPNFQATQIEQTAQFLTAEFMARSTQAAQSTVQAALITLSAPRWTTTINPTLITFTPSPTLTPTVNLALPSTLVIKNSQVNLRQGPGTDYDIIAVVEQGAEFEIKDYYLRNGESWYRIKYRYPNSNSDSAAWVIASVVSVNVKDTIPKASIIPVTPKA